MTAVIFTAQSTGRIMICVYSALSCGCTTGFKVQDTTNSLGPRYTARAIKPLWSEGCVLEYQEIQISVIFFCCTLFICGVGQLRSSFASGEADARVGLFFPNRQFVVFHESQIPPQSCEVRQRKHTNNAVPLLNAIVLFHLCNSNFCALRSCDSTRGL